MVNKTQLEGTPMYEALKDLAVKMNNKNMPPVELNVIGGFALMLHGVRPADGVTDIDFVGSDLPGELSSLIDETAAAYGMEPGWINKDGMASGIAMEDFELSTGELHFVPALVVGNITINVLEEKDLLRLKIIAVDTAMTELEATGEFARVKDFHDIHLLMDKMEITPEDAIREYSDYMICYPDTGDLIHAIAKNGPDGGLSIIEDKKQEFEELQKGEPRHSLFETTGDLDSFMGNINSLLNSMKGVQK